MVTASEEACQHWLKAKFYAKPFICINSRNNCMLGLLFLWWRSFKSGKTSHHLKRKISRTEAMHFNFALFIYFFIFLFVASYFVKSNFLNSLCQMRQCKHVWSHCKCVCLHRWSRPGMHSWLLAQETVDPLISGRRESGNGRHKAAHLRHVYFLQLKRPINYSILFISPLTHSLNKYFPNPYYTRHLKGEHFSKDEFDIVKGK